MNITEWKNNGCEYYTGVALYAKQSRPNPMLLRRFQQKKTEALRQKLIYELGKFESESTTPAKPEPTPKIEVDLKIAKKQSPPPRAQVEKEFKPVLMQDLPKELRPVLQKANDLFKENCRLKIDLNELKPEQEREAFEIQCKIEDNFKLNRIAWSKIDHYIQFASLPPAPKGQFDHLSTAQLLKREQYKYEAISKAKKRLQKQREERDATDSVIERNKLDRRVQKTENLLLKHEQELMQLKALINE